MLISVNELLRFFEDGRARGLRDLPSLGFKTAQKRGLFRYTHL
jgi:hypothetical protein